MSRQANKRKREETEKSLGIEVTISPSQGVKCPRCFRYAGEGRFNFDGLCDRCCHIILEDFPTHESAPHIQESYRLQREQFHIERG